MHGNIIDDTHKDHFVQMLVSAVLQELAYGLYYGVLHATLDVLKIVFNFFLYHYKQDFIIGTYYSILIYYGMEMAKYTLTATSFLNCHLLHYTIC